LNLQTAPKKAKGNGFFELIKLTLWCSGRPRPDWRRTDLRCQGTVT